MLERLAKSTARLFVKNNIADSECEEEYVYDNMKGTYLLNGHIK